MMVWSPASETREIGGLEKWDGCEDVGYRALGPVSATDVLGEKLGKLLQVVRRHQTHLEKVQFK